MQISPFIVGAILTFIFGTVVGSFLNVCIYRLPRGESLNHPPSHCPNCNTRLRALDLVPLLSFLALRAKCRYCGMKISWRYFIIEGITGLLFLAAWFSVSGNYPAILFSPAGITLVVSSCIFIAAMLVTFMIDLDTTYVIEPVTWVAMIAGVVFGLTSKLGTGQVVGYSQSLYFLPAAVPGMILGFLVFVAMDLFGGLIFRKPSMGLGDAYIGAAIGSILGPAAAMLSFGMAILLGAVIGVVFLSVMTIIERKRAAGKPAEEPEEEPVKHRLAIKPFFITLAVLGGLWLVEMYVSALLGDSLRPATPATSFLIGFAFAAVIGIALVLLGKLWEDPDDALRAQEPLPTAAQALDELPPGRYMPFGPFLTACAVFVALAPAWFMEKAGDLWHWWMGLMVR
ncbi:MAG: prepilin peptidase [Armatimonadota bacterium]